MTKYVLGLVFTVLCTVNSYSQNVGIGTNTPQTKLEVVGAISTTPATGGAGATIVIPANVSLYIITDDGAVAANAVTVTSPKEGQYLNILNTDAQVAVVGGVHSIPSGGVGQFQYISGMWRLTGNSNSAPAFTPGTGLSLNGSVLNSTWTKTGNDISNNNTGNVGIGTTTPNAAAILDVSSSTKGFLPPRMNIAQRNAMCAGMNLSQMQAIQGMTVYNTDNGCIESFIGTNATQSQNWQPIGCGCTSAPATPTAIALPNVVCQGYNSYIYSVTQVVGASSYNWTLPGGATIANGLGTSSITVNFAANATPGAQTISVTAVNSCGTSPALTQSVTVNEIPRITTHPVSATICAQGAGNTGNTSFSVAATGTGLTYQWKVNRNDGNGFVNITAGAPYTNFTTATLNITAATTAINGHQYQCVVSGSCSPSVTSNTATITISPTPVVNNGALATCSGTAFTYTPTGTIPAGTTFAWVVPSGSGFTGGLALSGQNNVSGVLTNPSTTSVATAVYTVTPTSANGCIGSTFTVTVTINPTPQVTAPTATATTTCNGGTQAAIALSTTNNVSGGVFSFTWTRTSNNGTGIGIQSATPVTAMPSFTATNSGTAATTDGINVSPIYISNGQTCTGGPVLLFSYTVNPTPTASVSAGQAQTLCVGNATTAISVSTTATGGTMTFPWTNNTTGINLAASGTNAPIASFTTTNTTTAPLVGTISFVPTYTLNGVGCAGTAAVATITVNPTPTLTITAGSSQTLCMGSPTVAITTSSTATGPGTITFPWYNNNTGTGLGSSGTTTPVASFTTANSSGINISSTITITPVYTYNSVSCQGTGANATIVVHTASVAGTVAQNPGTGNHVCQGSNVTYTLTGQTGTFNYFEHQWNTTGGAYSGSWGTTNPYTWNAGVNGASILYVRSAVTNGVCPTAFSAPVNVTVDAATVAGTITQSPGNGAHVCQGSNVTYTLNGQTGSFNYFQYQWNTTAGAYSSSWGTTNPYNWTSSLNSPSILYVRAVVTNGVCPVAYSAPVNVTVDAMPVAGTVSQTPVSGSHVCQGGNVNYTLSGQSGTFNYFQYQWNGVDPNSYSGSWGTTNPYNWASGTNGASVLYVRSVVSSGVCPAVYSAPVNVTVDALSSTGSFTTSPIYGCVDGTTRNSSGTVVAQGITGYVGTIDGWSWGSTPGSCASNSGAFPYAAGQANMGLTCCWPASSGNPTSVQYVRVTNGVCPSAVNCITVNGTPYFSVAPVTVNLTGSAQNVSYTVFGTGVTSYTWGATPAGWTYVSGAGTATITYSVPATSLATLGDRTVTCSVVTPVCGTTVLSAVTACRGSVTYNYTGGIQTVTIPAGMSSVNIETYGAQGGTSNGNGTVAGGLGARMKGTFAVTGGDVLKILVGGQGGTGTQGGGGGGSFVTNNANTPLCIAGGGGGAYYGGYPYGSGNMAGVVGTSGMAGIHAYNATTAGAGGVGSAGGGSSPAYTLDGSGGGGLNSDGESGSPSTGGRAFISGGAGGAAGGTGGAGGFGGGGGGDWSSWTGGGGGGGYSGGGGGVYYGVGGGGGSYNGGTAQSNSPGVRAGNGAVVFSY